MGTSPPPTRRLPDAAGSGGTAAATGTAGLPGGDGGGTGPPSRGELLGRSLLAVAVLAIVFGIALPRIADYGAAWAAVRAVGIGGAGVLLAAALLNLVAAWPPLVITLPGLRLREAAVVNQAGSAVSHTVPAGSAVAVGVSVHMLRTWGFRLPAIANQLLLTGVWNQLVKLGMPLAAIAVVAVTGELATPQVRLAAWGAGVLVAVVVVAALVLRSPDGVHRVGDRLDRLLQPLLRRWHRRTDLATGLVRTRAHVVEVVRSSGLRLSVATIASHLSLFLVLLVALRVVGVDADEVGWPAVLLAFALVRLLTAVPITPGGAGLVELGYVALLVPGTGGTVAAEVAAGVLLFRAITYLLPILLGGVAWVVFRSADSWRRPVGTRGPRTPDAPRADHGTDVTRARRPLVRSPIHAAQLVVGVVVTCVGWGAATLFEETLLAAARDLATAAATLPPVLATTPDLVATAAAPAVLVALTTWAVTTDHARLLALAVLAGALAVGLSFLAAGLLGAVLQPVHRELYTESAWGLWRALPTDPSVAGLLGVLAVVQPAQSRRTRRIGRWLVPVWLLATFTAAQGAPHLGVLVDVGLGLLAAGLVGVGLRSRSVQPDAARIAAGLAASGLAVSGLERARVDARGSVPWRGHTPSGPVFVKVLSREQRLADVLFRALRWLRLRRTGDAPPESSLRRAAEHEAFLSHHVRTLAVPAPRVRAVVGLGDEDVALVVDWVAGRSLDRVPAEEVTDDVLRAAWTHVRTLRRNGVAHRDLRLANIFLADDGSVLLIDFSFAELTASRQLLDTDVAELLAATAGVVGVERAVAVAAAVLGADALADASAWLVAGVLSTETRLVARRTGVLEPLRARVEEVGGVHARTRPPLERLHPRRVIGFLLVVLGLYAAITALPDGTEAADRLGAVHWDRAAAAAVVGLLWYAAAGAAYRAAAAGGVPLRLAAAAVLVGRLPLPEATAWSRASDVLAHVRDRAVVPFETRREASGRWVAVGMAVAPALVGGFVGAAVRQSAGTADGIAVGAGAGLLLVVAQVGGLRLTSWGRELQRVWLATEAIGHTDEWRVSPVAAWWTAAWTLHGIALVLAARAVGVEQGMWALLAVAIAADALSRLAPSPGGVGAAELLLFGGLLLVLPGDVVAPVVIAGRLVTFWLHLPAAFLLRHRVVPRTNRSRHAGP